VAPWREIGFGVILTIDVEGREQVKRRCPDAMSVFVQTSSLAIYEQRLRTRGTESEESLRKQLAGAQRELARAPDYDFQVMNDDLDVALASLRAILGPLFAEHAHAG
jgi:guanylate kinase